MDNGADVTARLFYDRYRYDGHWAYDEGTYDMVSQEESKGNWLGRRGPGVLEPPNQGHHPALRIHRHRRTHRPDQSIGQMGAQERLPAGSHLAR